jgi:hypothetical protein
MKRASCLRLTSALHISWVLFVSLYFLMAITEADTSVTWFSAVIVFSPNETALGVMIGLVFCITPFLTLLTLRNKTIALFVFTLFCNFVSLLLGISEFVSEANISNSMILLAVIGPALTILASFCGMRSVLFLYQDTLSNKP